MKNKRTILKIVLIFVLVACKLLACFGLAAGVLYKFTCDAAMGRYQIRDFDAHKEDFEFLADMCFALYDSKENADEYACLWVFPSSYPDEWRLRWKHKGDKLKSDDEKIVVSAEENASFKDIAHADYPKHTKRITDMWVTSNQVTFCTETYYYIICTRNGWRPSSAHPNNEDDDSYYLVEHLSGRWYQAVKNGEPWTDTCFSYIRFYYSLFWYLVDDYLKNNWNVTFLISA